MILMMMVKKNQAPVTWTDIHDSFDDDGEEEDDDDDDIGEEVSGLDDLD